MKPLGFYTCCFSPLGDVVLVCPQMQVIQLLKNQPLTTAAMVVGTWVQWEEKVSGQAEKVNDDEDYPKKTETTKIYYQMSSSCLKVCLTVCLKVCYCYYRYRTSFFCLKVGSICWAVVHCWVELGIDQRIQHCARNYDAVCLKQKKKRYGGKKNKHINGNRHTSNTQVTHK